MPDPISAVTAGATVLGAANSSRASRRAARAQTDAAAESSRLQREMFDRQVALQEPFRQGGLTAQNRLLEYLGIGGNASADGYGRYARDFGMQDFQTDPGYAFRLAEGNKALERSAASRGLQLSGSMLKGLTRFNQGEASQEYQNAFNRYQVNRANQINPLQSLLGAGQSSANVLTGAAGQLGSNLGENALQAGNARASGYIGSANAFTNAINQGMNWYNTRPA